MHCSFDEEHGSPPLRSANVVIAQKIWVLILIHERPAIFHWILFVLKVSRHKVGYFCSFEKCHLKRALSVEPDLCFYPAQLVRFRILLRRCARWKRPFPCLASFGLFVPHLIGMYTIMLTFLEWLRWMDFVLYFILTFIFKENEKLLKGVSFSVCHQ